MVGFVHYWKPKSKISSRKYPHVASVPCDRIKICGTILILVIKEQPSRPRAWWELPSRSHIPQSWGVSWWRWGANRVGTVLCTVPKLSSEGIPDSTNPTPPSSPPATSAPGSKNKRMLLDWREEPTSFPGIGLITCWQLEYCFKLKVLSKRFR